MLTFSTSHGCEGSPTTGIAIEIPEPIVSVTPTVNPNWTVETIREQLDEPVSGPHGSTITERPVQVVYTAKEPLVDGLRDAFIISVSIPDTSAGSALLFPVMQTCVEGETAWSEPTPAGGEEPEFPAPFITVGETGGGEPSHGASTPDGQAVSDDSDEHADHEVTEDDATAGAADETVGDDIVARILGIGGLVLGAVALVLALVIRRRPAGAANSASSTQGKA